MDATAMAFVTVIVGGISLQSPEPVTLEACEALKATQPTALCIDVEPPCGKKTGTACLGRADLEEAAPAKKKRRYSRYSRTARR